MKLKTNRLITKSIRLGYHRVKFRSGKHSARKFILGAIRTIARSKGAKVN